MVLLILVVMLSLAVVALGVALRWAIYETAEMERQANADRAALHASRVEWDQVSRRVAALEAEEALRKSRLNGRHKERAK